MIKCFLFVDGHEIKSRYTTLPAVPTIGSFVRVNNSLEQQTYKVLSVEFLDSSDYVNLQVEKVSDVSPCFKRMNW